MLHSERPDLRVEPIRGNVDTRLRRVAEGDLDGAIVAAAGLARLEKLSEASELLDPGVFVPAVGQGILAVQVRREENSIAALIRALDDEVTRACAAAERAVATTLGAGCQTPLGAYARVEDGRLVVDAFFLHGPGREPVRARAEGDLSDAVEIGANAARTLQRQTSTWA